MHHGIYSEAIKEHSPWPCLPRSYWEEEALHSVRNEEDPLCSGLRTLRGKEHVELCGVWSYALEIRFCCKFSCGSCVKKWLGAQLWDERPGWDPSHDSRGPQGLPHRNLPSLTFLNCSKQKYSHQPRKVLGDQYHFNMAVRPSSFHEMGVGFSWIVFISVFLAPNV